MNLSFLPCKYVICLKYFQTSLFVNTILLIYSAIFPPCFQVLVYAFYLFIFRFLHWIVHVLWTWIFHSFKSNGSSLRLVLHMLKAFVVVCFGQIGRSKNKRVWRVDFWLPMKVIILLSYYLSICFGNFFYHNALLNDSPNRFEFLTALNYVIHFVIISGNYSWLLFTWLTR